MFTFVFVDLPIDLDENSGVAEAHDQERYDVERDEVEHVIGGLLPSLPETSMCDTLGEVHFLSLDGSEDEQLGRRSHWINHAQVW